MSEPLMSVAGQLIGIPAEKYSGTNGVTVDQNNKTIGLDETVLFENPSFASDDLVLGTTFQLSESAANFERIRISWCRWAETAGADKTDCNDCSEHDMHFGSVTRNRVSALSMFYAGTDNDPTIYLCGSLLTGFANGTTITCFKGWQMPVGTNSMQNAKLYYRPWKVVGINRIGGNA